MTSLVSLAASTGAGAATFLAGVGLGLSVAMPVGPTSILCMSRTLLTGPATGLATGLAAATVHVVLSLLSLTAVTHADLPSAGPVARMMDVIAAVVLLGIAVRTARSRTRPQPVLRAGLVGSFATALAYCIGNPMTWLLIAVASPAALGPDLAEYPWLVAGVFVGSFGWWCCLTAFVAVIGRILPAQVIPTLRMVSAAILSGFAALLLTKAFQ